MLAIMVITLKSAVPTNRIQGESDRGVMLIYFVEFPVEMVFLTDLYRKKRFGAFYSG